MKNKFKFDPIQYPKLSCPPTILDKWAAQYKQDDQVLLQRADQALELAIQCVNDGSLTLLDSVDSPISFKIKEHFNVSLFEMNSLWIGTPQHWVCPCCGRSKFEIARLGQKKQILAKLVVHHDHIKESLKAAFDHAFIKTNTSHETKTGLALIEKIAPAFLAYAPILICEDCNNADARAKKLLQQKNIKPNIKYLSFSIGQIHYFIRPKPHSIHEIDNDLLDEVWADVKEAYLVRMHLIKNVAMAAVSYDYWYESYPTDFKAIPALTYENYTYEKDTSLQWLNLGQYTQAVQQHNYSHEPNWQRWRTELKKIGSIPPSNYLAIIHSFRGCSIMWDTLNEDWYCPICLRSKYEVVTNENGKVRFSINSLSNLKNGWRNISHICTHCHSILQAIKRELEKGHHLTIQKIYDCITPDRLKTIIVPRSHSAHLINKQGAKQLIEFAVHNART